MATIDEHMARIASSTTRVTSFNVEESDKNKYGNQNARECFFQLSYDFDDDAGAVGTVDLKCTIPAGTIIVGGVLSVVNALTSDGSATVEIGKTGDTAIIFAQTAYDSVTGVLDLVPTQKTGASTAIRFTEDTDLILTIGTAALTAGAFTVYMVGFHDNV